MKGRKPTPTVLKKLAGNPGKRPLNEAEPAAPRGRPECPSHLTGEAVKEWDRITAELDSMQLLHQTDRAALAIYCEHYRQWAEAVGKVAKDGLVVKMPNGWPNQNPYLAVANKAAAAMARMLVEFGCTPSSRSRVKATPAENAGDGDDFFGG